MSCHLSLSLFLDVSTESLNVFPAYVHYPLSTFSAAAAQQAVQRCRDGKSRVISEVYDTGAQPYIILHKTHFQNLLKDT